MPNLKFNVGNHLILWNKVMKEVAAKRFAGPFGKIPSEYFMQSPIRLVEKDGGNDTRLIFHLSYPRGQGISLNENMPKDKCTVHYPDFPEAIKLCLVEGKNCKIAQSDVKATFRNLCVRVQDFALLVMKGKSPIDGKFYYFFDKALPFGASISCNLFQRVSNAIAHVVKYRMHKPLVNYLDDYLFCSLMKMWCNQQVCIFMDVCASINFPVNMDKTYWGTTCLIFLGMLIDTISQTVSILTDKINKALNLIQSILDNKNRKVTLKQLQKLCGLLNFFGRCIIPGRAFTRRLYPPMSNTALKPHHHIRVNGEMRSDLNTWKTFLLHPSVFCRPFFQFDSTIEGDVLQFYTDSSGVIGMGGYTSWMFKIWPRGFLHLKPSIEFLELFALVAAVVAWIHRFANRNVKIFCDNESVKNMVNNTTSSCKNCMVLIRILVLQALIHNVKLSVQYVRSKDNDLADNLS